MRKLFTIILFCGSLIFTDKLIAQSNFGTDIKITNTPNYTQSDAKIACAFNGWLYSAGIVTSLAKDSSGIGIFRSKDKGFTWTFMNGYFKASAFAIYLDVELEVTGTDTNNLIVHVAGLRRNIFFPSYEIYIDNYNGKTGRFIESNLDFFTGNRQVYDIDLATDDLNKSNLSTPYTLGLIYSVTGAINDSVIYVASLNGGKNFTVIQTVATTLNFFRKVSLSYGKSASASNGRFFAAWERLGTNNARVGNIYTSRSSTSVSSPWTTPKNLDSLSSDAIGKCRDPRIATSYSTGIDNDSAGVTAIVLVDKDFGTTGINYDIIGFYNSRAQLSNFWKRTNIATTVASEQQSDIVYNDSARTFLSTYYNKNEAKLNYLDHSFNFTSANQNNWNLIKTEYNDANPGPSPFPRLAYNPKEQKGAAIWLSSSASLNAAVIFDSDYNLIYVSVPSIKPVSFDINFYPNPATDFLKLNLNLKKSNLLAIQVIDISGKIVLTENYGNSNGEQNLNLDLSNLATGLYVLKVNAGNETASYKISIQK